MKRIKTDISNKIQLAAEVNAALNENNLVIVTKSPGDNPVYHLYGTEVDEGPFTLECDVVKGELLDL